MFQYLSSIILLFGHQPHYLLWQQFPLYPSKNDRAFVTIKTLAEKYITVILSILQGMPSRHRNFDPSTVKPLIRHTSIKAYFLIKHTFSSYFQLPSRFAGHKAYFFIKMSATWVVISLIVSQLFQQCYTYLINNILFFSWFSAALGSYTVMLLWHNQITLSLSIWNSLWQVSSIHFTP